MTLFEKIIRREIPSDIVYEDDLCFAFRDINPQAPTHVLVVPKKAIARLGDASDDDESLLGHLLLTAGKLAGRLGIAESGFRVVINHGPHAGESVPHMHVHLLGGRAMSWPPG